MTSYPTITAKDDLISYVSKCFPHYNYGRCLGRSLESPESPPEYFVRNIRNAIAELRRARSELRRAKSMSLEEAEIESAAEYEKERKLNERDNVKRRELKTTYDPILAGLDGWNPPTKDHAEFKDSVKYHIKRDGSFFCSDSKPPEKETGASYKKHLVSRSMGSVIICKRDLKNQIKTERAEREWVRTLLDSLPS